MAELLNWLFGQYAVYSTLFIALELIAVIFGVSSVLLASKTNILVFPIGLVSTAIFVYLLWKWQLFGDMFINAYYSIMSIYGWILWAKRDATQHAAVKIQFSDKRWWLYQLGFFAAFYIALYFSLQYLKENFAPGAIPWADAFAAATAFTGMWLMTKKKVESWYWWIATNIASIPLYFVKHYVFTSVYYIVLLVMAVFGLIEWIKKSKLNKQ